MSGTGSRPCGPRPFQSVQRLVSACGTGGLALGLALVVGLQPSRGSSPDHVGPTVSLDEARRWNVMCGPNSVYLLLRLHQIPVSYDDVARYIPSNVEGMSLLEMQQACADLGLPVEIRSCSVEELWNQFQGPVVGRIYTLYGSARYGHYVLVIRVDGDWATAVDPTSAELRRYPRATLGNVWSGYIVVPKRGTPRVQKLLVASCVLLWVTAAAMALTAFRKPR